MSYNDFAIKAKNLSKVYRIGLKEEMHDSISTAIFDFIKSPLRNYRKYRSLYRFDDVNPNVESNSDPNSDDIIWALRDVSFEVKRGEALGIIGGNGAGKSTLLKILSKITSPTTGIAEIRGRVSSLLEVGTGFHPELTGRENVYLNGTILGMAKKEIDRKFDEIVEFSGVQKFIDTPVKRYSSGMQVRLAFSVAAHLEPEILIVDEVLAVGDARFQKKCIGRMKDIGQAGRTVIFVSHNMTAINSLCQRAICLDEGRLLQIGEAEEIVRAYLKDSRASCRTRFRPSSPIEGRNFNLIEARVLFQGETAHNGQELIFETKIELLKKMQFAAHMFIYRDEELVLIAADYHSPVTPDALGPGMFTLNFKIPPYLLNPGNLNFGLLLSDYSGNSEQYLSAQDLLRFDLEDDRYRRGNRYLLGWGGAVSPILPVSLTRARK